VSFILLSGMALQLEGENYFGNGNANIPHASVNVSSEAFRLSDYTQPLALWLLQSKASSFLMGIEPSRLPNPRPTCEWLGPFEPGPWNVARFNAGARRLAPEGPALLSTPQELAEMMREGGSSGNGTCSNRVRLRVNEATQGWQDAVETHSKLEARFTV